MHDNLQITKDFVLKAANVDVLLQVYNIMIIITMIIINYAMYYISCCIS